MEPTKRPWHNNDNYGRIEDANDNTILWNTENREHVVCCVNAHDDLVAACEAAHSYIETGKALGESEIEGRLVVVLNAAIRKAKGKQCTP